MSEQCVPVYVLAYYDALNLKDAWLAVTTFDDPHPPFRYSHPMELLRHNTRFLEMELKSGRPLDNSKVWYIHVENDQRSEVSKLLYAPVASNPILSSSGIFGSLCYTNACSAKQRVYGNYKSLTIMKRNRTAEIPDIEHDMFTELLLRLKAECNSAFYHRLDSVYDLRRFHSNKRTNSSFTTQLLQNAVKQVKRPTGAALLFGRCDVEDSQAPLFQDTQLEFANDSALGSDPSQSQSDVEDFTTEINSTLESITDPGDAQKDQNLDHSVSSSNQAKSQDKSQDQCQDQCQDQLQPPSGNANTIVPPLNRTKSSLDRTLLVNKLSILDALLLPCTLRDVLDDGIIQVCGKVLGIVPNESFIVKPFKRTLKVAPFKLYITSPTLKSTMIINFHNEAEITRFLLVDEVEELFMRLESVESQFYRLIKSDLIISLHVKRKVLSVNRGIQIPHWVCRSRLLDIQS